MHQMFQAEIQSVHVEVEKNTKIVVGNKKD
jgi:hypothetical protein